MACNEEASHLSAPMEACYPTGCPPCAAPIDFPDDPKDGQRFCVPVGSNGETKCWVYDLCVPAWRAEGPSASPTRYRGGVDIKTQKPAWEDTTNEIQAGDWYIQTKDETSPYQAEWGLSLGNNILSGTRLAYNGVSWQELEPANIPYAEMARDETPDPEDRGGGIVKLASTEEVEEGTNKCNPITPYTLKDAFGEIPEFNFDACDGAPDAEGPERVAFYPVDPNTNETANTIQCKTLAQGTTDFYGVGQIATNFANDRDTYGAGYDTDWLTNAAMAPIINAIVERVNELEEEIQQIIDGGGGGSNPPSGITPIANVVRTYTENGAWTPIDPDNISQVAFVLTGGIGGSATDVWGNQLPDGRCTRNYTDARTAGPIQQEHWGEVPDIYRIFVTGNANIPKSGNIIVGAGGLGSRISGGASGYRYYECNTGGTFSSFASTSNGFSCRARGGRNGPQDTIECLRNNAVNVQVCPVQDTGTNSDNLTEIVTSQFPVRYPTRFQNYNMADQSGFGWSVVDPSPGGFVTIYEYYPSDWVNPNLGGYSIL